MKRILAVLSSLLLAGACLAQTPATLPPSQYAGTSGGTAQAQTVTISPAIASLKSGLRFSFKPGNANSGAAPTIAVNGLTATATTKCGTTALVANDLTTLAIADVQYDGTEFQLLNPQAVGCPPTSGSGTVTSVATGAGLLGGPITTTGTLTPDPSVICMPGAYSALTDAATVTWAVGSVMCANASLTFTVHSGSRTLNITGLVSGGNYILQLKQDSTGGEGLTLGTGCSWKVSNGGGGAITPSTGANAIDVLAFSYNGTSGNCLANFNTNFN